MDTLLTLRKWKSYTHNNLTGGTGPQSVCSFLLLQTVASRLVATTWTPFLYLIQTFTYIGFVIGTALGYSRFQRRHCTLADFLLHADHAAAAMDTGQSTRNVSWRSNSLSVAGRCTSSTSDFLARRPVDDPLFFVAIMSIAFWIISSWAGFTLVRNQNYLGAVLPAAIGLLIIQDYDNISREPSLVSGFVCFLALLLLGRLQFLQNKGSWRARHIFLSPDNSFDLTSSMAVMPQGCSSLWHGLVPASISSLNSAVKSWDRMTHPWREFTEEMENAVSALQSPNGGRPGRILSDATRLWAWLSRFHRHCYVSRYTRPAAGGTTPALLLARTRLRSISQTTMVYHRNHAAGISSQRRTTAHMLALKRLPARFVFQIGEAKMFPALWTLRTGLGQSFGHAYRFFTRRGPGR